MHIGMSSDSLQIHHFTKWGLFLKKRIMVWENNISTLVDIPLMCTIFIIMCIMCLVAVHL